MNGQNGSTAVMTEQLNDTEIKALKEMLNTFTIARDYLNDQVVKDLCGVASNTFKLVNAASGTDLIPIFEKALQDPQLDKALIDPPSPGMFSLLGVLSDPDAKRGLGIMIAVLKAFGRAAAPEKQGN